MKKIKELSKQIHEEIKDAKKYAEDALRMKESDKELSELYYSLAGEELRHMERLHTAAVREIAKHKASGEKVPEVMEELWKWQHEEIVEESTEVRMLLDMYQK